MTKPSPLLYERHAELGARRYNENVVASGTYSHNRTVALERFAPCLRGSDQALFLVLAQRSCSVELQKAIEKAAHARGYERETITWLFCDTDGAWLEPDELFDAVEGLDPASMVVLGASCLTLFAQAYRIANPAQGKATVLGRPVCLAPEAETLIQSDKGKQKLWALMKALPALA